MKNLKIFKLSNTNHQLDLLHRSLSDFGLCPNEWKLTPEDGMSYKISNKFEPNFFFRGHIQYKNGCRIWSSIYLVDL